MKDLYTAGIWIDTNLPPKSGFEKFSNFFNCCGGTGTLGVYAKLTSGTDLNGKDVSGKTVLLTCQHVVFPEDNTTSASAIFQPRYSSCCSGDQIAVPVIDKSQYVNGHYVGGYKSPPPEATIRVKYHNQTTTIDHVPVNERYTPPISVTDCLAAVLAPGVKFQNVWKGVNDRGKTVDIALKGAYSGGMGDYGVKKGPSTPGTLPTMDQYVRVYSERLGKVVYGTIAYLPGTLDPGSAPADDPQRLLYPDANGEPTLGTAIARQLMFLARPDPDPTKSFEAQYDSWSGKAPDHGDSGTVVINSDGLIVGMIASLLETKAVMGANMPIEFAAVPNMSLFTPIADVLSQLNVTIPNDANGWSGAQPSEGARVFVPGWRDDEQSAQKRGLERLREGLRKSRRGRWMMEKIGRHGRELRFMFARVRELSSAWQRLRGPAFMHHGVRSVERPGHRVPHMIDGVSRRKLVETLLPIVEQHASPPLKRDLARHRQWAIETLLDLAAVDDVIDAVARPRAES